DRPTNPSELWGEIRLVALVGARRWDDALAEARSLPQSRAVRKLLAHIELAQGHVWDAMVTGFDEPAMQYVIRVLMRDDELAPLAESAPEKLRAESIVSLGVRRAEAGDWRGAADL